MRDPRERHAPAAERNKAPILEVLVRHLPRRGRVLELASGSGQHVVHFATALPDLVWQPSDPDPAQRASIEYLSAAAGLGNVEAPLALDVLDTWPALQVDAVITANLLHVAPPRALEAVCAGAAGVLAVGGLLHVYGPFKRGGAFTSDGDRRFDEALREKESGWGIRDLEALLGAAAEHGLELRELVDMPANNFSVVLARRSAGVAS